MSATPNLTDYSVINCIGERRPAKIGRSWPARYTRSSDDAQPSHDDLAETIKQSPDFALEAIAGKTCEVAKAQELMAAIRATDSTAIGDLVLDMIAEYFAERVTGDPNDWHVPEDAKTYARLVELHDGYVASDMHSYQMAAPQQVAA